MSGKRFEKSGNSAVFKVASVLKYSFLCSFVGLPHLATYIFSMNEPELGAGIDPGMAFNPFPSSTLDKTRFESHNL